MPFLIPIVTASVAAASAAAAPIALAGAGVSAYMGIQQGKEAEGLAKDNADMAQNEADMEATRLEKQNQFEQEERLKERDLVLGKIRRSNARSGLTSQGSPLLAELETTENLTMDMRMSAYNTYEQIRAVKYRGAATSAVYKQQGASAKRAGYWSAGQSIIGGLSAVSSLPQKNPKIGNYKSATTPKNLQKIDKWLN